MLLLLVSCCVFKLSGTEGRVDITDDRWLSDRRVALCMLLLTVDGGQRAQAMVALCGSDERFTLIG